MKHVIVISVQNALISFLDQKRKIWNESQNEWSLMRLLRLLTAIVRNGQRLCPTIQTEILTLWCLLLIWSFQTRHSPFISSEAPFAWPSPSSLSTLCPHRGDDHTHCTHSLRLPTPQHTSSHAFSCKLYFNSAYKNRPAGRRKIG